MRCSFITMAGLKNEHQWRRAAIYLRVSRDDQTTENQRLVLAKVAEHRGWLIVQAYQDQGISGAKGRDRVQPLTRCSRTRCGDGSMS